MVVDSDRTAVAGEAREGRRLGGYTIVRSLGRGGMGTVYEAQHPRLAKRVALKAMQGSLAGDPVAEQRFLREAQAIARITHPHVVEVFDVGIDDGCPFIVMELLEGETLGDLLAREGRLGATRLAELMLPVFSAVAAIHDGGVVHRDLKPANVMLARRGRFAVEPVVFDFGICRIEAGRAEGNVGGEDDGRGRAPAGLTDPDLLVGTLPYLSPEQIRDARAAGPRSDQYALAVMLYECLTGRNPFAGGAARSGGAGAGRPAAGDRYEQMHAAMTAVVTPPGAVAPDLPAELDRVVLRAMSRSPDARYPSVRAFGSALLSFAGRAAWKRWAVELAGADPRDPPADAVGGETASDLRRPVLPARVQAPARPIPGRRRQALVAAAAAVVAAAVAVAVLAPGSLGPAPVPSAPVLPAAAIPQTTSAAAVPEAPVPTLPVLVPPIATPASRPARAPSRQRRRPAVPQGRVAPAVTVPASSSPGPSALQAEAARPTDAKKDSDDEAIYPYPPLR
jgi:hypothetical protein